MPKENRGNDKVICPYCGNEAIWCENKVVYGRNYGKSYMMWYCQKDDAYVGCHQNTKKPLGRMANRELREIKKKAKKAWMDKYGKYGKRFIYQKLAQDLGIPPQEAHFGMFDVEMCKKVLDLLTPTNN